MKEENNRTNMDVIRTTRPFNLLSDTEFMEMTGNSKRHSFKENEFLFHEEDEEVEMHFLLQGLAKNVLHRENGQPFSVRFYYPGDLIGTLILLAGNQLNFSVQALERCETVQFNKAAFLKVMTENKLFSDVILGEIGDRMKSLYEEIKRSRSNGDTENIPLYRTRIRTIMEKVPAILTERTIKEAARTISELRKPGLIVWDRDKKLVGIITQHQIVDALMQGKGNEYVQDWAFRGARTIQEDAFCYEALPSFKDEHVDLLPVLRKKKVVGIVTAESFLLLQDSKYINLSFELQHADSPEALGKLSPKNNEHFISFTDALLRDGTPASEVCELISNYNDLIHRKAIKIALKEMKEEGYGLPPVNYCFIVMGSQGRKEQAFSTDQDNGFILDNYEHLPHQKDIINYFKYFAEKINRMLVMCGFPECTGGIMAREEKWCRSLQSWTEEVKRWVKETDSQEVRDFTIFVDYRPVFGDFDLAIRLREAVTPTIQKGKILHAMLMKDTIRFRVPINSFNKIVTKGKSKSFDLKKSAMMQIVNGVRIFAIRYGIMEVSTSKRLDELEKAEAFHPRDVKNAKLALDYLHLFRIREHMNQLKSNIPLSNELSITSLTKEEKKRLKESLTIAKRLQQISELSFAKNRGI
ncbi:DUF294 nucleotidyltransferase-like domain-containing protein [Evansella tamaricis]|uniref:Cyclic nucleotide-binding domain-containing protein n=1 Tax=Evansella tamaricis TaxID=2069301 RepID=A0ABS6JR15_9BACI|nr:DUF294 nucleotidyltransferase-like domain-containing protein [Evansella tamaricis]MBU9714845.1 cyclic nucleotide-binding domain-containing protein [Evansella tamaricis]